MPHPLEAGTIRILKPDGSTAGTGFLLSKQIAVTCAHVVESTNVLPGSEISFMYHLGGMKIQNAIILENGWSKENDVAILKLTKKPPKWIHPLIMQPSVAMEGRAFQGLGYPDDGPVQTRWPQGNVSGRVDVDEYVNPLLQLQGKEIDKGLSGSAMVDRATRRVIAMITAYQDIKRPSGAENIRFGYAIPIETIWKVYPELEKELPPLPKRSPLVEGIHLLPYGYDYRIQQFLDIYLGTSTQPEPFGGRKDEFNELDKWLEGHIQRLVLAAPAGCGKSALLVQWLDRILVRDDLALVFIPVSVRLRTNLAKVFFASLAARLAYLHQEEVPLGDTASADDWRRLAATYLTKPLSDERKLVIVLDGLDEAGDWEASADLIPTVLPKNVRVVVSARIVKGESDSKYWLTNLGWERKGFSTTLDLKPLRLSGVADILEKMGILSDEPDRKENIAVDLYYLSEGDPLLIHLYVEDLWSRGGKAADLKPENLRNIERGYEGYFDNWWRDQEKLWEGKPWLLKHVKSLRKILAGAMGPLTIHDIGVVVSESDSDILEEAIDVLKRFVIGVPDEHNDEKIGYVFTHPKLRDYFWNKQTDKEKVMFDDLFVDWGEQVMQALINKTLMPIDTPIYLIQYYGAHLERTNAQIEKLLPIVDYPYWHQAWFAYEDSYSGYFNDVMRVWKCATTTNKHLVDNDKLPNELSIEIRCALIVASLNSLMRNIPPSLIASLFKNKRWSFAQTIRYIQQESNEVRKESILSAITPFLTTAQLIETIPVSKEMKNKVICASLSMMVIENISDDERKYFLGEALENIFAIPYEGVLTEKLNKIAHHLSSEQLEQVMDFAENRMRDKRLSLEVRCEIAKYLPGTKRGSVVEDVVTAIGAATDNANYRNKLLIQIADLLSINDLISLFLDPNNKSTGKYIPESPLEFMNALERVGFFDMLSYGKPSSQKPISIDPALSDELVKKIIKKLRNEKSEVNRETLLKLSKKLDFNVLVTLLIAEHLPLSNRIEAAKDILRQARQLLFLDGLDELLETGYLEREFAETIIGDMALEFLFQIKSDKFWGREIEPLTQNFLTALEFLPLEKQNDILRKVPEIAKAVEGFRNKFIFVTRVVERLPIDNEKVLILKEVLLDPLDEIKDENSVPGYDPIVRNRKDSFWPVPLNSGLEDIHLGLQGNSTKVSSGPRYHPIDQRPIYSFSPVPSYSAIYNRSLTLVVMARYLPAKEREDGFIAALGTLQRIPIRSFHNQQMLFLFNLIPDEYLHLALEITGNIRNLSDRQKLLEELSKRIPKKHLGILLSQVSEIGFDSSLVDLLFGLIEGLPKNRLKDLFDFSGKTGLGEALRLKIISHSQVDILNLALGGMSGISTERQMRLQPVHPVLLGVLFANWPLKLFRAIRERKLKVRNVFHINGELVFGMLLGRILRLSDETIRNLLDSIELMYKGGWKLMLFVTMSELLPDFLLPALLKVIRWHSEVANRKYSLFELFDYELILSVCLISIGRRCRKPDLNKVLSVAKMIKYDKLYYAKVLQIILNRLPIDNFQEFFSEAEKITEWPARLFIITALLPRKENIELDGNLVKEILPLFPKIDKHHPFISSGIQEYLSKQWILTDIEKDLGLLLAQFRLFEHTKRYEYWRRFLESGTWDRDVLIQHLHLLGPLTETIADKKVADNLFVTVRDVNTWWS